MTHTALTAGARVVIEGVTKRFGPHPALDNVSMTIEPGEVVALLGDNGAGKSTLVKCLAGVHSPDNGTILIDGTAVHLRTPHQAALLGIAVVYQDLALFDNLSVASNLFAGHELARPLRPRVLGVLRRREMSRQAQAIIRELEVRIPDQDIPIGLLSGGQRQAVAVAKAVAFARRLVILDEPTAALGVRETRNVLALIQRLSDQGISVLLISHNLEDVLKVADKAVVLRQGVKVGELRPTRETHEQIVSMIVGGAA